MAGSMRTSVTDNMERYPPKCLQGLRPPKRNGTPLKGYPPPKETGQNFRTPLKVSQAHVARKKIEYIIVVASNSTNNGKKYLRDKEIANNQGQVNSAAGKIFSKRD